LAQDEKYQEAIAIYQALVELNNKDMDALLGLAKVFYLQQELQEADKYFAAAKGVDVEKASQEITLFLEQPEIKLIRLGCGIIKESPQDRSTYLTLETLHKRLCPEDENNSRLLQMYDGAIKEYPENGMLYFLRGDCYKTIEGNKESYTNKINDFLTAIKFNFGTEVPNLANNVHYCLAQAYLGAEEYILADKQFGILIEKFQQVESAELNVIISILLAERTKNWIEINAIQEESSDNPYSYKNLEEIKITIELACKKFEENSLAHRLRGDIAYKEKNPFLVESSYNLAITFDNNNLDAILGRARMNAERNNYDSAMAGFKKAIKNAKLIKFACAARRERCEFILRIKREYDIAAEDAKELIKLDSRHNIKNYKLLGEVYKAWGQFDLAIQAYEKAIQLQKTNQQATKQPVKFGVLHYELASVYVLQEQWQKAIALYQEIIGKYSKEKMVEENEEALEEHILKRIYLGAAQAYLQLGKYDQVLEYANDVFVKSIDNKEETQEEKNECLEEEHNIYARILRAEVFLIKKDYVALKEEANKILSALGPFKKLNRALVTMLIPNAKGIFQMEAHAYFLLAVANNGLALYAEANINCMMAIQQDSQHIDVKRLMGELLLREKKYDAAMKCLNAIIKLNPEDHLTYRLRAQVYLARAKPGAAFADRVYADEFSKDKHKLNPASLFTFAKTKVIFHQSEVATSARQVIAIMEQRLNDIQTSYPLAMIEKRPLRENMQANVLYVFQEEVNKKENQLKEKKEFRWFYALRIMTEKKDIILVNKIETKDKEEQTNLEAKLKRMQEAKPRDKTSLKKLTHAIVATIIPVICSNYFPYQKPPKELLNDGLNSMGLSEINASALLHRQGFITKHTIFSAINYTQDPESMVAHQQTTMMEVGESLRKLK